MYNYTLVKPHEYTENQIRCINELKESINIVAQHSNILFGIKDVESRHIIATDYYATCMGFTYAQEIVGKLDHDTPCSDVSLLADTYQQQDQLLLKSNAPQSISTLNILNYKDGLKARIFNKYPLIHKESNSILGIVYHGYDSNISHLINILANPNHAIKPSRNTDKYKEILTTYEQEICFLLLLGWDHSRIATYLNKIHPGKDNRSADTIIKKRIYICKKLNITLNDVDTLREYLINTGFQHHIPQTLYEPCIGTYILEITPLAS